MRKWESEIEGSPTLSSAHFLTFSSSHSLIFPLSPALMVTTLRMFYTTVGRKLVMALTGLFLCTYLIEHLYGNLLLYKYDGGKAYNEYTETLTGNIIIRTIEFVLFAAFIIHILDALFLTMSNRKARPVPYEVSRPSQTSTWFSRNMGI